MPASFKRIAAELPFILQTIYCDSIIQGDIENTADSWVIPGDYVTVTNIHYSWIWRPLRPLLIIPVNRGYISSIFIHCTSLLKYTVSLTALVFYLLSGTPSQSGVLLQAKGCQLEGLTYAGVSPAGPRELEKDRTTRTTTLISTPLQPLYNWWPA